MTASEIRRVAIPETNEALVTTEASTLGLAPGEWPERLSTMDGRRTFARMEIVQKAGDVTHVEYVYLGEIRHPIGAPQRLRIYND
jgi:hypothetical protein